MSQAGQINSASGPVPPAVPTSFVTDVNSPSVPVASIENVIGGQTSVDTVAGIRTDGSSGSNTLTVQLTNRLQGTVTTAGAVTSTVITFSLGATPAAYKFHFEMTAFNSATPAGLGYSIEASARTTGLAATIISIPDADEDEDVAFATADWAVIASGNNILLQAVGVAALTINWSAVGYYVKVT